MRTRNETTPPVAAMRGRELVSDLEHANRSTVDRQHADSLAKQVVEHLGYEGAAAYIGVPIGTVRAWVARKQIPHLRLGPRLVRFAVGDLKRWLDARRVEANQ